MRRICKVFKIGGSNSIIVGTAVMKGLRLKPGDYVEVDFQHKMED